MIVDTELCPGLQPLEFPKNTAALCKIRSNKSQESRFHVDFRCISLDELSQ